MLKERKNLKYNSWGLLGIKINEMFDKKYSFPRMFKELAATDWECYKYFKSKLKEDIKTRSICNENLDLLKELNEKYEPQ